MDRFIISSKDSMGRFAMKSRFCILILILLPIIMVRPAWVWQQKTESLSYQDAQPVLTALAEALPEEFKGKKDAELSEAWSSWLARYELAIKARLLRGDEDSLVNFLFYGTSFTKQRRLSAEDFKSPEVRAKGDSSKSEKPEEIIQRRMRDLVEALLLPGKNERLQLLRNLLEERGHSLSTPSGQAAATSYIVDCVVRVLQESQRYAENLHASRRSGDPAAEFTERSTLFRNRGISLDTSLLPGFAVEESLKAMRDRGLIVPGSVRKVAIVGPGLDFTDKDAGFDLYPLQTIQPFALMDSLIRTGLAHPDRLEVSALDISPRVLDHIAQSRLRASRGGAYTIRLVRDSKLPWRLDSSRYWRRFGDQIGQTVPAAPLPSDLPGQEVRAVRVRPDLVSRLQPVALNIVTQHLALPDSERFDLMIATNIFVYYSVFEQSLALANVERMLRPGCFLLSNNALLELPTSKIHAIDHQTVIYSARPADGDHILWYQHVTAPASPKD